MSARATNLALVLDDLSSGNHPRDLDLLGLLNLRLFQAAHEVVKLPEGTDGELRGAMRRTQQFRRTLCCELSSEFLVSMILTTMAIGGVLL